MKVLFLDIDGVVNSLRTCHAYGNYPHNVDEEQLKLFDHTALKLIRNICNAYDIKIVLSSCWRNCKEFVDMPKALDLPIIDKTPQKLSSIRGEEIQMWLREHPEVTQYVIVDDDSDMLPTQRKRFVRTDRQEGLSFKNYRKICKLFGVPEFIKGL